MMFELVFDAIDALWKVAAILFGAAALIKKNNSPCRQLTFLQLDLQKNQHVIANKLPKNFGQSRMGER